MERFVALLLVMAVFCCTHLPAAAAEKTVLRVGYYALDGYQNQSEDGTRSGYGYDVLQLLARYENISYTYHGYDESLSEALRKLEKGELDLVTAIKRTPDMLERFDFSDRRIGVDSTLLTVKEGNTRIISGQYNTYKGIRIGMLKGSYRSAELAEFAKEKGFDYRVVNYDTTQQMTKALQDGNVDALVGSSLRTRTNEWILDSFNESQIYAIVRKGDKATLNLINRALDRMSKEETHWIIDLQDTYYTGAQSNLPFLTQEELAYLQKQREAGRKFSVLVNPDRYPYSYVEEGELKGIMIDLFDLIAQRAGIDYEWMLTEDREHYADAMNSHAADICIDLTPDFYLAETSGYTITDTYLTAPFSWIRRSDNTGDIKLAAKLVYMAFTPAQYAYHNAYHKIEYITYPTEEECLQSVLSGETDAYCTYTYKAEQLVVNNLSGKLISTISQSENKFAIGIAHEEDILLTSILNTTVDCIEEWEQVDITRLHSALRQPNYTFMELVMGNRYIGATVMLSLLTVFLLTMLVVQQLQDRKSLKQTIRIQRDRLNEALQGMVTVLATAIEFRSVESGDHVQRIRGITHAVMTEVVKRYPQEYPLPPKEIDQIALAAILHDVGKIAIPDHILNKPGKLSPVEFETIKQHPVKGCGILEHIPNLRDEPLFTYAWDICRWHHERWDGRGYPEGLKGKEIPIWAQAAAVADVYDALTSPRVYKEAYTKEKAIEMILAGECGSFNPQVLEAFSAVADKLETREATPMELVRHAPANRDLTTLMITAFQALLENTGSMVFLKDVDLVYRSVSPAYSALFKRAPEEMLSRTDKELFDDKQKAACAEEEDLRLLSSGEALVETLDMFDTADHLPACISTSKHLLTDSQGRLMGILGICRDVTAEYYSKRHHHLELTNLFNLPPNAYFSLYMDITAWRIVEENRQAVNDLTFQPHDNIQSFIDKSHENIVDKSGPAYSFYRSFNTAALQELYHSGRSDVAMEYRRTIDGFGERWIRDEIKFMIMPSNGHLSMLLTVYDIHSKKMEEQQIIKRAERDPLTNLLNRSSLQQLVNETLAESDSETDIHAMFIIDLDDFKHINDTLGHMAGDECLRQIASAMQACFRSNDLVGRIGGDEFAVFMRHVPDRSMADAQAEILRSTLEHLVLSIPEQSSHSVSIGVSLYPISGDTLDQLYEKADQAMYQAKRAGKNRAVTAEE